MHANLRPTSSKAGPIWKLSIQLALTLATSTGFILLGISPNALAAQSNNDTPPSHAKPIDYVQAVFSVQYGSKETAGENLLDRKSTRLNSSHVAISYAVFCLKKKTNKSITAGRYS